MVRNEACERNRQRATNQTAATVAAAGKKASNRFMSSAIITSPNTHAAPTVIHVMFRSAQRPGMLPCCAMVKTRSARSSRIETSSISMRDDQ